MLSRIRMIIVFAVAAAVPVATISWAGAERVTQGICQGQAATITGTPRADNLVSDEDSDIIAGLGGNDTINGRRGFDTICGGGGNDTLLGGPDNDKLFGERGRDFLKGGPGRDRLVGGPGRDTERR